MSGISRIILGLNVRKQKGFQHVIELEEMVDKITLETRGRTKLVLPKLYTSGGLNSIKYLSSTSTELLGKALKTSC